jgi:AraC-like DNA-binding protein
MVFYENRSGDLFASRSECLTFPAHLHTQLELLYIESGEIEVSVNNQPLNLKAGDFAVIFPNRVHSYASIPANAKNSVILVISDFPYVGDFINTVLKYHPSVPYIESAHLHKDIPYALNALAAESMSQQSRSVCTAYMQIILARILPQLELVKNTESDFFELTYKIVNYISQNFNQPLSLDVIARELGISKYNLSRFFSNKMNIGFNDYINSLRVGWAQNLLRSTDKTVTDISFECGFESTRTFNRAFKKTCGLSPQNYRNAFIIHKSITTG